MAQTIQSETKHATRLQSEKLLYTLRETAALLSVSEKSVRRLLDRQLLKANPALRVRLITRESIESFAKMTL
jgi:hypothetical protein